MQEDTTQLTGIIDTVATVVKVAEGIPSAGSLGMCRSRPYNGDPWTINGTRGSTIVSGLTLRDIQDCFIRAFIIAQPIIDEAGSVMEVNFGRYTEAMKGENAQLNVNDIFDEHGDTDPTALVRNLSCEIEKMMGIYPNISHCTKKFKMTLISFDLDEEGKVNHRYEKSILGSAHDLPRW